MLWYANGTQISGAVVRHQAMTIPGQDPPTPLADLPPVPVAPGPTEPPLSLMYRPSWQSSHQPDVPPLASLMTYEQAKTKPAKRGKN